MPPAAEAARDKIVDDLLPRLVEAVNAAAAAAAAAGAAGAAKASDKASDAADTAKSRGSDAVAVAKGEKVAKKKRSKKKVFLFFTAIAAGAAAARAVLKSRGPAEDPWAIPEGTYPGANSWSTPAADRRRGDSLDSGARRGGARRCVARTTPRSPV